MGTSGGGKTVLIGGLVIVFVTACTSSSPRRRPSSAPASTPASSSRPSDRPAGAPVELSCADSTQGTPGGGAAGDLTVNGLTLESAAGNLRGAAAAAVGVRGPAGPTLYFVKSPAYLTAATSPITVELAASSSGYLAWVPARIWTGGNSPIDLRPWATSRLTFDGCPDRDTTYLGGLLATDPHLCLIVHIGRAGSPTSKQTRLGGTGC